VVSELAGISKIVKLLIRDQGLDLRAGYTSKFDLFGGRELLSALHAVELFAARLATFAGASA